MFTEKALLTTEAGADLERAKEFYREVFLPQRI